MCLAARLQTSPVLHSARCLPSPPTSRDENAEQGFFIGLNMEEIWNPIPGYEGQYEASNQGRVRSNKKILAACNVSGGYKAVSLGKNNSKLIHRLVAAAFLGPAPSGKQLVLHSNGDRYDNRLSNLRYGSHKDNSADAKLHGTQARGERQHAAKLTTEQVLYIRASNETSAALAKKFSVTTACISAIIKRKNWRHV